MRWSVALAACTIALISACHSPTPAATANSNHHQTKRPIAAASASKIGPGPGWKLVWSDDFNGSNALKKWTFATGGGGWGTQQLQVYSRRNAMLAPGGGLVITATRDGYDEECWYGPCIYSSARLETKGLFMQKYGLIEARIKLPAGRGLWPAFWMEGANSGKPYSSTAGEVDVIETANLKPDQVLGFLHGPKEDYAARLDLPTPLSANYHVYAIDWTPKGISWIVDDRTYAHVDAYSGWPFSQPFFFILNLAVGGGWPGSPSANTMFPAQMDISWIHVYQQQAP
jgi:beta-glucanase (GH16 family)